MEARGVPLSLAALSLGASLGDPLRACRMAVAALDVLPSTRRVAASRLYRTPPFGGVATQPFVNGVVVLETTLSPGVLRAAMVDLERRIGRRPSRRWADRVLDLDLLLYGAEVVDEPGLAVPHPRLAERPGILAMLVEAWPDARDPRTGLPWRVLLPGTRLRGALAALPRPRLANRGSAM